MSSAPASGSASLIDGVQRAFHEALLYGATARRVLPRGGRALGTRILHHEQRLVFVVGCPRSGTTFLGGALGAQPGFVDLGEVAPLKAILPLLPGLPVPEAARRIRRILERVRRLSAVRGLRGVEQTPETAFSLQAALLAYPDARAIHIYRDGRDVACSLLERGWLSTRRAGADDAGHSYGAHTRFWVEPERAEEFARASDATRAAWAWRRYVTAARSIREGVLDVRYEKMVREPSRVAEIMAAHLAIDVDPLRSEIGKAHGRSVGRHASDLSASQRGDVEREAGELLRQLGYA
jgi:hypothetical protein